MRQVFLILCTALCISSYAQTILSGNISVSDIPEIITTDLSTINTVQDLNQRIDRGGQLILKNGKLVLPQELDSFFLILDKLELSDFEIITNGNEMTIISNKIISKNTKIKSFSEKSNDGKNGSDINIYNIESFIGLLKIDSSGNDGKNGARGYNGRNSRSRYGIDCRSPAKDGRRGKPGGNGGNGGNLNIFTIYNPIVFELNDIIFSTNSGKGGKGGIGGKGGRNSGPCRVGHNVVAANGPNGRNGNDGSDGKIKVKSFKLSDLLN